MQVELMYQHAYTLGRVRLAAGEQVRVEAASMVGMSASPWRPRLREALCNR
jgi:hypothetical protein